MMSAVAAPVDRNPVLESLADPLCTADADWRVTYWNAAAERWFGVPRHQALGRLLWEAVECDEPAMRRMLAPAMNAGRVARGAYRRPQDRHPSLTMDGTPLEGGGIAVHFHDILTTDRIIQQWSQLLEFMRDGYVAVDGTWRISYMNPAAEALLGVSSERVLGFSLADQLPAEPPELIQALADTMARREPRHLQAISPRGRRFRGRRFDVWVNPLEDGGMSLLFQDVTDQLRRESELARLAAEAEDASRAKSRFFAAVSHELRTPLHAIVGYTHLLSTDSYGQMPSPATRAAERASVCAEHLARLIDDVLLLTTTEIDRLPVYPSPVALGPYLDEVLEPLRRQALAKGLGFELHAPPTLPQVETDPERVRQLLYALVTNAVKFTSRGRIRVVLRAVDAGVPALEVSVEDTGPGMAPEDSARVFEAFEQVCDDARTDSIHRGTGLGLTIARQLARLLGGTLQVDTVPGAGSTFRFRLPLRFAPAAAE